MFKKIYDGSPKSYPSRYMMLFIPLLEGQLHSTEFCEKKLLNHNQYIGEEGAFLIRGFQDLKNHIHLKTGNNVSLQTLLKSIPASSGMSQPQLFHHVEPSCSHRSTNRRRRSDSSSSTSVDWRCRCCCRGWRMPCCNLNIS